MQGSSCAVGPPTVLPIVWTEHCLEADGVVASHRILRGRHVGPWLGQEPTGRRVALRIMDFLRFEDGRIIEHWSALRPADSGDDEEASTAAGSCVPL